MGVVAVVVAAVAAVAVAVRKEEAGHYYEWYQVGNERIVGSGHRVIMVMMMVVPATRESTNIMSAIAACSHILQPFKAVPFGIMFVDLEVDVVVVCCIIKHLVVGAGGATRLSAIPAQELRSRCSGALADGRWVGGEARLTALGARRGVPVLSAHARVATPSAPLAARALGRLLATGTFWWRHPRLVRGGWAERSTAPC
jgi:hypothetical protein